MSHKPAGGLHSKNTRHIPQPKVEPRAHRANVEPVSQQGVQVAFQKQPLLQRNAGYNPPVGPKNNLVSGPGGGRNIYQSGSQHGLVDRQMPEGKDILSSFGPESTPRHKP
jgi:hypothetical protein